MPPITTGPRACQAALTGLASGVRACCTLAESLDSFAGQLRSHGPDPDGPPLEQYPTQGQVRRALERLDRSLAAAREQWEGLPADVQACCDHPEDLLCP